MKREKIKELLYEFQKRVLFSTCVFKDTIWK